MAEHRNIHGRKGTRGIRPWLLVPKVLGVGMYFGGLMAAAALWFGAVGGQGNPLFRRWPVAEMRVLVLGVVVPGLLLAVACGVLLLLEHPKVMARLRWWQVKMLFLALGLPAAHLFMASRLQALRAALAQGQPVEALARQISTGLVAVLVFSVWIIGLGRLKPRLGQNWARSYPTPARRQVGGADRTPSR